MIGASTSGAFAFLFLTVGVISTVLLHTLRALPTQLTKLPANTGAILLLVSTYCSGAVNLIDSDVNEGLVLKIGGWKTRKMLDRYNVTNRKRLAAALGESGEYVAERMNGTK